jgi:hypothetical protein
MNKITIINTGKTPKIKINDATETILNFDALKEIGKIIIEQKRLGTYADFEITAHEKDVLYKNTIAEIIESIKGDSDLLTLYNETKTHDVTPVTDVPKDESK